MKIFTLALSLAAFLSPKAEAATINLIQGGWDVGGPLTITFTAEDLDSSGSYDSTELVAFEAAFPISGDEIATFAMADLVDDGFFYASSEDYFIRALGPFYNLYEIAFDGGYVAFVGDFLGQAYISSSPLVDASSVPEPGTAALFGAAILGIAASRRTRN